MEERLDRANAIVRRYSSWSFVGGLIPSQLITVGALIAIQLKMLYDLSKLYELPFQRSIVKSLIGSLLATGTSELATQGILATGVRMVPIIGSTVSVITMPAISTAATYAMGKVFVQHFEAGGTFLDFDPVKVRDYYRSEFESARSGGGRASRAPATA